MSDENTQQETPKDLRDARDRAIERASEAEKAATAAQSELRQFKAQVTFEKAGLTPKHADLFLKANPDADVTTEAVSDFAHEYGLVPTEAPAAEEATEPQADPGVGLAGFGDAAGSGTTGSAPAAQPKMSGADFEHLLKTNPEEAAKAYAEGRTHRNSMNVQARDLVQKGIIDH